jgi:hypothetical protein
MYRLCAINCVEGIQTRTEIKYQQTWERRYGHTISHFWLIDMEKNNNIVVGIDSLAFLEKASMVDSRTDCIALTCKEAA